MTRGPEVTNEIWVYDHENTETTIKKLPSEPVKILVIK